jgi:exosortase
MNGKLQTFTPQAVFYPTVVLLALVALYFPTLQGLAHAWNSDSNYSHGWFIPLLSAAMIYSSRQSLADLPIRPCNLGLPVLAGGLILYIAGRIGTEFFIQRISLIVVLAGQILFLLGREFFRHLLLPLLYLIFMIPLPAIIWNRIAFPMQIFSSFMTEQIISLLEIPILRQGNVLYLANTTLEVVDACSGLRSLVTMFALAGALAIFTSLPNWEKWLLFLSAAPIAVLANIIRLSVTVLLATRYGASATHGFLHDVSGLLVFVLGLSLLFFVKTWLAGHNR